MGIENETVNWYSYQGPRITAVNYPVTRIGINSSAEDIQQALGANPDIRLLNFRQNVPEGLTELTPRFIKETYGIDPLHVGERVATMEDVERLGLNREAWQNRLIQRHDIRLSRNSGLFAAVVDTNNQIVTNPETGVRQLRFIGASGDNNPGVYGNEQVTLYGIDPGTGRADPGNAYLQTRTAGRVADEYGQGYRTELNTTGVLQVPISLLENPPSRP